MKNVASKWSGVGNRRWDSILLWDLRVITTVNMTDFWNGAPSNFMLIGKAIPVTGRGGP
jgi:hypothetical protein